MSESPGHRSLNSGSASLEPRPLADAAESGYEPNVRMADKLYQAADILAAQGAVPFRVAAYRRAADTVCALDVDLATIAAKGGRDALGAVPGIGPAIAGAVAEMLATGSWAFLNHLTGPPIRRPCSGRSLGSDRNWHGAFVERCTLTPSKGLRRPSTMDGWGRSPGLGIAAPRWSGLPSQQCSPGFAEIRSRAGTNRRSTCYSTSTASIVNELLSRFDQDRAKAVQPER